MAVTTTEPPASLETSSSGAHKRVSSKPRASSGSAAAAGSGAAGERPTPAAAPEKVQQNGKGAEESRLADLAFCFFGLQVSYLTWGYIQEKIMTKEYGEGGSAAKFPSATFCVFSNRVLAIALAGAALRLQNGAVGLSAPCTAFLPCSLSNSLSSFAQYEALRHISFPLQTLSKSCKVILVMLMGKLLNGKVYAWGNYLEALVIAAGVSLFAMDRSGSSVGAIPVDERSKVAYDGNGVADSITESVASAWWSLASSALAADTLQGLLMLGLYLGSDSFTSQWQSRVYKAHAQVDQYQMMLATNLWSALLTLAALAASGELLVSLAFLAEHSEALVDNALIALTSATGQMFIFRTIKHFGPVAFTIMMTTRQIFSMVLSAVVFEHNLGAMAWSGAVLVFAVAFARIAK